MPMEAKRVKVLMFAEAVTLAHVARPLALASFLDPARYEVVIACDRRYSGFVAGGHWQHRELTTIPSERFLEALARGSPVYDFATLAEYFKDDARLIESVSPDIVVGDFRLSLSVSARMAKVPYIAIANAYWSPAYQGRIPVPVLPMTKMLPLPIASTLFGIFQPLAFAIHCGPLNRLRKLHGLPSLGYNLRRIYTDSDHLLVPDLEQLHPLPRVVPSPHTFLGPLLWSPRIALPDWWDELSETQDPVVYVALGSSGSRDAFATVLRALDGLPIRVIASSAGALEPAHIPQNASIAPYLPGDVATARAKLVICNGGSMTTQQALDVGVPMMGIASNMDQFFNMAPIQAQGAGVVVRADRLSADAVRALCTRMLGSDDAARSAIRLRAHMHSANHSPGAAFDRVVDALLKR